MAKVREGHGGTIQVPPPVPLDRVRQRWDDVPELACVVAWQAACRAWWEDEDDRRLRTTSLEALSLDDAELADWLRRRFDTETLIRAHGHVTALRAGLERDLSRRTLVTGSLRTYPVWTDHHDRTRRMFAAAEDVPRYLNRASDNMRELPDHPFIRAAWLSQMLGVVHPFRDANGGTARFLASLELARSWLPPLVLSVELRNGAYIEALAMRDNLDPLALVVYEAVQQGLASALLDARAPAQAWTEPSRARAERWTSAADAALRAAVGASLGIGRDVSSQEAAARLLRSGCRLPSEPGASYATWHVATPVPAHIDLAIVPLCGGSTGWIGVVITGRAGECGELPSVLDREHVATYFVAPDGEPDKIVDARFDHWLDARVEQVVRGLARWM